MSKFTMTQGEKTVFTGVEQLESAAQSTGWDIEYRQLQKGAFHSWFSAYEAGGIQLALEGFDNRLQVCCVPPSGFFGIMFPYFKPGSASVLGQEVADGDVAIFPKGSELEILTCGAMENVTLFLSEDALQEAVRVLAPGKSLFSPRCASLERLAPWQGAQLQHLIRVALEAGAPDAETLSNLLASTILCLIDAGSSDDEQCLSLLRVCAVARRARDYIEAHYRDTIRMQDLCNYTGIGLRTLQRCFSAYYQISPSEYVKTRRLNAVRRDLSRSDPAPGLVADVALRNGMTHFGRFSGEYRKFFGESPSATLRSRVA